MKHPDIEVRSNERGIDEIVSAKVAHFHLEYMDDDHVWIGLTMADGEVFHIDLTSRGKIKTSAEVR